jgi:hypothetical protein
MLLLLDVHVVLHTRCFKQTSMPLTQLPLSTLPVLHWAPAAGYDVTFIHPKSAGGVLVELVQAPEDVIKAFS